MDNRILITGQPGLRRQERYTGFYTEREKLLINATEYYNNKCLKTLPRHQNAAKVMIVI